MDARQCFQAFGCQPSDQLLVVKEQHLADSNFVFAYLMKQALLDENNRVLLLLTHNSLPHYECVAKKIGLNLINKVQSGMVHVIDLQSIVLDLLNNQLPSVDLLSTIQRRIQQNVTENTNYKCWVFIDDYTHIQDCTHDVAESINFLNMLLGEFYNETIRYIVGLHVGDENDRILSSDLEYSADCIIDVSLMKTGRSDDISGILKVLRNRKLITYHYKVREYGVDIIAPGNFLIS
ncbi:uncharacterized protein [Atheta coriaria]|uniref:uncharacterized protein n=1 Tax=Dalotia coriaria TaxID=877792 RepID=UPI0031F3DC04